MEFAMLATITDKGQVTVPKEIRDQLGLAPGVKLDFQVEPDGTIRVRPLTRGAGALYGMLRRPAVQAATVAELNESVGTHVAADDDRIRQEAKSRSKRPRQP